MSAAGFFYPMSASKFSGRFTSSTAFNPNFNSRAGTSGINGAYAFKCTLQNVPRTRWDVLKSTLREDVCTAVQTSGLQ